MFPYQSKKQKRVGKKRKIRHASAEDARKREWQLERKKPPRRASASTMQSGGETVPFYKTESGGISMA